MLTILYATQKRRLRERLLRFSSRLRSVFWFSKKKFGSYPQTRQSGYFSESDMIFFSVNPGETPIQNDIFPKETTPTECKRVIFFNWCSFFSFWNEKYRKSISLMKNPPFVKWKISVFIKNQIQKKTFSASCPKCDSLVSHFRFYYLYAEGQKASPLVSSDHKPTQSNLRLCVSSSKIYRARKKGALL